MKSILGSERSRHIDLSQAHAKTNQHLEKYVPLHRNAGHGNGGYDARPIQAFLKMNCRDNSRKKFPKGYLQDASDLIFLKDCPVDMRSIGHEHFPILKYFS